MKILKQAYIAALLLCSQTLAAKDLNGNWQGALEGEGGQLRLMIHIEKGTLAEPKVSISSMDMGDWGSRSDGANVSVQGASFKMGLPAFGTTYVGKIATDGNSITGTWTGRQVLPLTLVRVTAVNAWKDPSPHSVQFVTVEKDIKLEVLDWGGPAGGKGRTLVLLAGLGNTAHVFDDFATKLISQYHVIGITRRGFGASSAPESGYGADRLGDDVLAVMAALKLNQPVLVGHSIAGEELSSIGSRYPDKVAGLVYLEAAWIYAFYSPGGMDLPIPPPDIPRSIRIDIMAGAQKYTSIPVPVLALYAQPLEPEPGWSAELVARQQAVNTAQVEAFEKGVPTAHVVRIAHSNHFIFRASEAEVLREMNTFMSGLK